MLLTDVTGVGQRGFLTLVDQSVVSGTNFVTGIVMARSVPKEDFGLFVLGLTVILVITNILTALISTPLTYIAPRLRREELSSYLGSTAIHQFSLAAIVTSLLFIASLFMSLLSDEPGLGKVLLILAFIMPITLFREYIRRLYFATLKVKNSLVLDIFVSALQISGLLALVFLDKITVYYGLIWIGISCLFPCLIFLVDVLKLTRFQLSSVVDDFLRGWAIAKWVSVGIAAHSASNQSYPWMLAGFHGAVSAGVFGACMGPLLLTNPFFLGMANFLGPNIAHEKEKSGVEGLKELAKMATLLLMFVTGIFCIFLFIFGDQIVVLFYGNQYGGNGLIVSVLAVSLFISGCVCPIRSSLIALDKPDLICKSFLAELAVAATIGIWAAATFGPLGAAAGLLAGNTVASGIQAGYYWKAIHTVSED